MQNNEPISPSRDVSAKRIVQHFANIGVCVLLLVIGVALVSLSAFGTFAADLRGGFASNRWIETTGQVQTAYAQCRARCVNNHLRVRYTYSTGNSKNVFFGSRVRFGDQIALADDEAQANAEAKALYPVGSPVKVYFDPANPAVATLTRGLQWSAALLAVVVVHMVAALIIVGACVNAGWREVKQLSLREKND